LGVFEKGEILLKARYGPMGYIEKRGIRSVLGEDGWFHTKDIGYYDDLGRFYVCCRVSDILHIGAKKVQI
jgi:acyl-CoA synthetase (AMP-forming)/AMP-acid ligase II